jgi:cytochrome c oxidase accessory protein FixG
MEPEKTSSDPLHAPGRLLSTMNEDGSRRWLRPRVSTGRFWHARRVVAYALIIIFALVPHLSIGGKPVLLLDVIKREFTILGTTFLPTDTVLMALLMVTLFASIFLITALFGRVWCGWACPQTVYMEFLYRPIERLFDGAPGKKQRIKGAKGPRKIAKYVVFVLCSLFLAHTFLAYFVPPRELITWVTRSPFDHPTAFLVMAVTTGLMLFDFGFFREQVCLVACPYGRLQAAMLDRQSMIISYDERRGEPRGKLRRPRRDKNAEGVSLKVIAEESPGDCIDCHMCVTTCPTGIDIRDGLQMECIGCAQCIDACNTIMDKVGKPRGLIRYSSRAAMEGERTRVLRPRIVIYPAVIAIMFTIFLIFLGGRQTAEAQMLPRQGMAFYEIETGEIVNQARVRLVNRGEADASFAFSIDGVEGARVILEEPDLTLTPGESRVVGFMIAVPPDGFGPRGRKEATVNVSQPGVEDGFAKQMRYNIFGPPSGGGGS